MDTTLLTQSLTKFFLGVVIISLLLFLPAGSFRYWQEQQEADDDDA